MGLGTLALGGLVLASCAVGPNFKRPAPPAAADYGSASSNEAKAAPEGVAGGTQRFAAGEIPRDWWTLFQSPVLVDLVQQALAHNADLDAAHAALKQAHELYLAQRAALLPTVQGSFQGSRNKNSVATIANPANLPQSNPYYDLYTAQVSVTYMLDVFGGTRRAIEASKAQADSVRFQYEATYVSLSSNVVVTAIQEASLRAQVATTERLIGLEHQLTETVRGQRKLGTANALDELTQESVEAQTRATLAPLQKQLGQTRDALIALLGRLPSEDPGQSVHLTDLTLPRQLPISLPSRLVTQRADVAQAEANLHAASAEDGVAIANLLPQFPITGDLGSDALRVSRLFTPYTGFWTLGGSITQTLFDGGALLHQKRAADAALDQAAAQYRSAVILACQNVADAMRALTVDAQALDSSADAERAAKTAFDIAQRQRALGTASTVAVLNAEQVYRQAELALVQAQASRFEDTAALFQALGGGWWADPEGSRGGKTP